jgi:phenylpyruvate tautomerase PptA (4-oxalocrotonate tautomerase family)
MARGRKAEAGTFEAREKFKVICAGIQSIDGVSNEAKKRIVKALKFGLGIKEEAKEEKQEVVDDEKEIAVTTIKEKKATRKVILNNVDGDEYFAPEDCKEVGY